MTLEQRKIELVNWIARLENESVLLIMEDLKDADAGKTPSEILALLKYSNQADFDELKEHTSARDLVSNS